METTETDLASEINTGFRQQMLEWRLQYVAWALLYALLVAVMFGALGKGPLSTKEVSAGEGVLTVRYERFLRRHSPDVLHVVARAASGTVEIRLDNAYLQRIRIEAITPQPERAIAAADGVVFVFNARPGATVRAAFEYRAEEVGRLNGRVSADGRPALHLRQFVYP